MYEQLEKLRDIDTDLFSPEAKRFRESGSSATYCSAPEGTLDFAEYWTEQKRRRIEGYEVNGVRITGAHYGYLNFSKIQIKTQDKNGIKRKKFEFPRFYDMDWLFFNEVEAARKEEKGLIVAKARRKGFSYKIAWLVANEFTTIRESVSVVSAGNDKLADNTIGMVIDNLEFLNKHTAWYRNREPNRREFMKAQTEKTIELSDGTKQKTWEGSKSEIHKISFKDGALKGVGKSASLFIFEEAGVFKNLIESYNYCEPTWKDGDDVIGMPILFGSAGDMEAGSADFAEMFYNPELYNLKAFTNIWDENASDKKCGFFVPDYLCRPPYITDKGISLIQQAIDSEIEARNQKLLNAKRKNELDAYISQYCHSPREAFLVRKGNLFPAVLLSKQLADIENKKHLKYLGERGRLELELNGTISFEPDDSVIPVTYPINRNEEEGCIIIYERPENPNSSPYGLYYAGCDPYDTDQATSGSLGSCIIWKTFKSVDECYDLPVATYHGRPDKAKDFYENVRRLIMYYNAHLLYENEKRGLEWYFEEKKCLYLMKDQPFIIDKILKNSSTKRPKGTHMVSAIKDQILLWAKDWLLEEDGEGKYNLTKVYDPFLLKQLISYNDEDNFDSVMAFCLTIMMRREMYQVKVQENSEKMRDDFFTKKLFSTNNSGLHSINNPITNLLKTL